MRAGPRAQSPSGHGGSPSGHGAPREVVARLAEELIQNMRSAGREKVDVDDLFERGDIFDHFTDITQYRDHAGMTVLHHACRMADARWIKRTLHGNFDAAELVTYSNSAPANWTTLQCLVNNKMPTSDVKFEDWGRFD